MNLPKILLRAEMIQLFHSFSKGSYCTHGGYQKALPLPSPSKNGKITGKQVLRRPGAMTSDSYEGFRLIYLVLLA